MNSRVSGLIAAVAAVGGIVATTNAPAQVQRSGGSSGAANAQLMMQKLPMCNDPKVDQYLTNLGMKLVSKLDQRGVTRGPDERRDGELTELKHMQ